MDNAKEKFLYSPAQKFKDAMPVWFCFPYDYLIGMSSLGFTELFRILDQNPKVNPERIFTDTKKTKFNSSKVELCGFSFSFELDFLNVFKILENRNIPLRAEDRDDTHPLVFAGGPAVSVNPEPYAEFFDFFNIGDGEEIFNEINSVLYENKDLSRKERLLKLSEIEGIYVPSLFEFSYTDNGEISAIKALGTKKNIKKRSVKKISLSTSIITPDNVFAGAHLVELSRGCPQKCGFCLASYSSLPCRYPSIESIKNSINIALEHSSKVGLLGALIASHPQFDEICDYLSQLRDEKEFEVSVSSLRADKIEPKVVQMLVKCGQKTSTIAVEAGSERLRKLINKDLSNEQIFRSVKTAGENGLSGMKIYGMIGLPSETDEDIQSLIDLMKNLKTIDKKFSLTLSISSFVPKAQTPFQWIGREESKTLNKKNNYLKKELHKLGIKFKPTSVKWDYIQAVLSRGDRRLAPILEKVYKYGGSLGSWGRAYKEAVKYEKYQIPSFDWYALRDISSGSTLPWECVSFHYEKSALLVEKDRLLNI